MYKILFIWYAAIYVASLEVSSDEKLPSAFYQPGPGVIAKTWNSAKYYDIGNFKSIRNFPNCPNNIENINDFEYSQQNTVKTHQYGLYQAIFASTQSGKHRFFAKCKIKCQVFIDKGLSTPVKILDITNKARSALNNSYSTLFVDLLQGVRYEITIYQYGNRTHPGFFQLGVQFPDSTELIPIGKEFLHRSMEYYKLTGLLVQKYQAIISNNDSTKVTAEKVEETIHNQDSLSSFSCSDRLYIENFEKTSYFAWQLIGYLKVPEKASYQFNMTCNKVCEIFITKDGIEESIRISTASTSQPWTMVNAGTLQPNKMYPIKVSYVPGKLSREMKILHKNNKSTEEFSNSWEKMLHNLKEAESQKSIPDLTLQTKSSTSVAVKLPSKPRLPKKDNWTYIQKQEIHYFQYGYRNEEHKGINTFGQWVVVAGLHKNTMYGFYAHYFGKINEKDQNIVSRMRWIKTYEDVPDSAPAKVTATTESPTSIKLTWSPIANSSLMNGVGLGYELRHRAKDSGLTDWKSNIIHGIEKRFCVLERLKKGTVYEFKVAARTKKGSGVFSNVVQKHTNNEYQIFEEDPTSFQTNILFADKTLERHVDKVVHVKTVEECFNQCRICIEQRVGCQCESFNISKKILKGTMVCEINSGSHKEFPSDLVDREGYQYYIVM